MKRMLILTTALLFYPVAYPNTSHAQQKALLDLASESEEYAQEIENVGLLDKTVELEQSLKEISEDEISAEGYRPSAKTALPLQIPDSPDDVFTLVGDGEGGAIYFWESRLNGNIAILSQRVDAGGRKLWNNGSPIIASAGSTGDRRKPAALSDGRGGAFVFFHVEFKSGQYTGEVDIFGQHIDADGTRLWNNGSPLGIMTSSHAERNPIVVSDGSGGAILIAELEFTSGAYAGDFDVVGQRVASNGNELWRDGNAVLIVGSSHIERNPAVVSDGSGGAIVAVEVELTSGQYAGDASIFGQRLDAGGNKLWNGGQGSVGIMASAQQERYPVAVSDGSGGAIVVAEVELTSGSFIGDIDVRGQRIDAGGNKLWNDGQRSTGIMTSSHHERGPVVVGDGSGGAIVVAEAEFTSGQYTGDISIFGQRLDGGGNELWLGGSSVGIVSNSTRQERNPAAVGDGSGGVIVVAEAEFTSGPFAGDISIFGQRMDAGGNKVWNGGTGTKGIMTSARKERSPAVISDGPVAIVGANAEIASGSRAGDRDIFGQRVGGDGNLLWNSGASSTIISEDTPSSSLPKISISSTFLVFAETDVGSSRQKTLTVSNTGEATLHVTAMTIVGANAGDFSASPTTFSVDAGQSQSVIVRFSPTSAGAKSAVLSIVHNAEGSPSTVSLSGSTPSQRPAISISSTFLAFAETDVGSSIRQILTVSNTGNATLRVAGITIVGANAGEFSVSPASFNVNAGQSQSVIVMFSPTSAGAKSAVLSIVHNAEGSPSTVSLSGSTPSQRPVISIPVTFLAFVETDVGSSSRQILTVSNTGNATLRVTDMTVVGANAGEFSVSPASFNVNPGQSQSVIVTFSPTSAGVKSAVLSIVHNAEGSPSAVSLSGTTPSQRPDIFIPATSLAFADTDVGASSQKTLTVSNTGDGTLRVTGISIAGANAGEFSASPATFSVDTGRSQSVTVTFSPTSAGAKSAVLSIVHNAEGSPSTVSLSGTSAETSVGPIALDMDLDDGDQGQRQTKSVPKVEDQVVIDIVAISGAADQIAYQIELKYDPAQIEWVGFQTKGVFVSGIAIPNPPSEGTVKISVAILGGKTFLESGSMGHVTFKVLDGFTGETTVELISASYEQPVVVGAGGAVVTIGGATTPDSDFNDDRIVDFGDFILFARVFGAVEGDGRYEWKYDLDMDGEIGFSDFIRFAQDFGKPL